MHWSSLPDRLRAAALLVVAAAAVVARANWLSLAISGAATVPYEEESADGLSTRSLGRVCTDLRGLDDYQKQLCYQQPYIMPSVGYGAKDAIIECQWQFRNERWNCTTMRTMNDSFDDVLGSTLRSGNKETAFVSAITSAGLVHAVTRGCSVGNLSDCGCDNRFRAQPTALEDDGDGGGDRWNWGGCSDNVRYGLRFAKRFLDRHEKERWQQERDPRRLMNLHNHDVGRAAVSQLMFRQCRCHGVSGSCEFKTCWQQMPKFKDVGALLKERYDDYAVQVARRAKKRLRRKIKSDRKIPLRQNELAYVYRSPNYCVRDEALGILGTKDRQCNQTSFGRDSCDLLCCGRGYNKRVQVRSERCNCKFVWCCYVKCKTCNQNVTVYTCK